MSKDRPADLSLQITCAKEELISARPIPRRVATRNTTAHAVTWSISIFRGDRLASGYHGSPVVSVCYSFLPLPKVAIACEISVDELSTK